MFLSACHAVVIILQLNMVIRQAPGRGRFLLARKNFTKGWLSLCNASVAISTLIVLQEWTQESPGVVISNEQPRYWCIRTGLYNDNRYEKFVWKEWRTESALCLSP
jgi:hypothetical protein